MSRRGAALLAAALAVAAAPALGQEDGRRPQDRNAVTGSAGLDAVQIRTRPDAVGDVYRFRSDTDFVQKDARGQQTQTNTQVFEIAVRGVEPQGLGLRYTLREADGKDSADPSLIAVLKAAVGGALDYRVARDGAVTGLDNWPDYKAAVLARIDAALAPDDPARVLAHERFDQPPLDAALELALADVRLLGVMELRGRVPLGLMNLLDDRDETPAKATIDVTVLQPNCRVRVRRETSRTSGNVSHAVVTEAELSVSDGRVLTLRERKVVRTQSGSQTTTTTVKRLSAAPAC